jgi:hypothetical protein
MKVSAEAIFADNPNIPGKASSLSSWNSGSKKCITTVKDKLSGWAKEIAAEILGDSKLADEGASKGQVRRAS